MLLRASSRSVLPMLAAVAAVGLTACEPMEPSGEPFAAVPVMAAVSGTSPGAGSIAENDPRFGPDGAEFTSEELKAKPSSDSSGGGAKPSVQVGSTMQPADSASTASSSATAQAATAAPAASAAVVPGGTMAWPVRLVRTHLDEQPPSAVLALPDGRRIVVSPGDMVPERGLVVMAIGKERIQLAAISSRGDHATVVPMELSAQY